MPSKTKQNKETPMVYRDAGVDIDAGDQLIDLIRPLANKSRRSGALGTIGGFGALFELPLDKYHHPVLVSGTDGVGTKLKVAFALDKHDTIGIDLVAMCANDVVACGAEPLFFLDYFAIGALDLRKAEEIIRGIAKGCQLAGAALIGGETAEMPGFYVSGEYDLAGFCVGIVEKTSIINGEAVRPGNLVLGLASSGPHSNGFSMVRAILKKNNVSLLTPLGDTTLGDALLSPTRIYVRTILSILKQGLHITGIAHITGGGLIGNIKRIMPSGLEARIESSSWETPIIFKWIQDAGNIVNDEMFRTFNCGLGLVLVVDKTDAESACEALRAQGEQVTVIGKIMEGNSGVVIE